MTAAGDGTDTGGSGDEQHGPLSTFRQFFALEPDVLVLSVAMFAFSLAFQMTSRYLPEYMYALGASGLVVGIFGTVGNVLSAVYPYPGGAVSDRIGSRYALTLFGLLSTLGFLVWLVPGLLAGMGHETGLGVGGVTIPHWLWIFAGLLPAQAWKSLGLGATFAIVKQSVAPSRLARGFASTETFRRTAFLVGPLLAAVVLYAGGGDVLPGFPPVLAVAVAFGCVATVLQHVRYDTGRDTVGKSFEGIERLRTDLRNLPAELRPLLVGDTLVRFANGMVYVFFVIVVTRFLEVDARLFGYYLSPEVLFGLLLAVEMAVALLVMAPAARIAESVGLKPVVAAGFAVYAVFPVLLVNAPANAVVVGLLFAFSGLRFAGLPSHKALIVGPSERDAGGRTTGAYYLLRNAVVIPSGALGGVLWDYASPEVAFTVATGVGLVGTSYFLAFGEAFEPYAAT